MLRSNQQNITFAIVCAEDGTNCRILHDGKELFNNTTQPFIFAEYIQKNSAKNYARFIKSASVSGFALCENIGIRHEQADYYFSLFGISKMNHIFIIAAQSPQHLFGVYDDLTRIINEQARMLREAQKQSHVAAVSERQIDQENEDLLQQMMQLNNELSNMQRMLAVKNRQLEEQEKRFRELVTFTPDAQLVLSEENTILFLNPAAEHMLEMDNQTANGQQCPFPLQEDTEICFQVQKAHVCVEIRSKTIFWDGQSAKLISLRDITERKRIEQIKEDIQRITQHDLISPLNSIISLPSLFEGDTNLTEDQWHILRIVAKAGNRMYNMIRLSLNLHKMEEGNFTFTPEPVDVHATLKDVLADHATTLRLKSIVPTITINGHRADCTDPLLVLAEPTLCYSVLANLLLNAIEASDTGDTVSITCHQDTSYVISIHNSQPVPEQIRHSFFDKYATAGKQKGTGLGTYSAKLITTTLGGTISMHTSKTEGTTVTVKLPAHN